MGDIGAVTVAQGVHTRVLLAPGVLRGKQVVGGALLLGQGPMWGDVYVAVFVMLLGKMLRPPAELLVRLGHVDAANLAEGLAVEVVERRPGHPRSGASRIAGASWTSRRSGVRRSPPPH